MYAKPDLTGFEPLSKGSITKRCTTELFVHQLTPNSRWDVRALPWELDSSNWQQLLEFPWSQPRIYHTASWTSKPIQHANKVGLIIGALERIWNHNNGITKRQPNLPRHHIPVKWHVTIWWPFPCNRDMISQSPKNANEMRSISQERRLLSKNGFKYKYCIINQKKPFISKSPTPVL